MKHIVITQPVGLTDAQLTELKTLGDVTYYDNVSKTTTEWLERVKDADIIYTNIHGIDEGWQSLHDVFVTLPFVGVGFLDKEVLAKNNVIVSRSPGCNRVAVSEWIVGMLLNYARRFPEFVKVKHFDVPTPFYTTSLFGKTVCVVGKGNIGSRVGGMLEALGMNVRYHTRTSDLAESVKDADYIVDCIGGSVGFYDQAFFDKTKDGVVFATVSSNKTKDMDVVLKLLESGKIQHLITDNAQALLFDVADADYQALLDNPNVTITPHVAAYSDNTRDTAAKMCIENIKAYLAGEPINIVGAT